MKIGVKLTYLLEVEQDIWAQQLPNPKLTTGIYELLREKGADAIQDELNLVGNGKIITTEASIGRVFTP